MKAIRAGGCDRVSVSDRPDGKSPFSGETGNELTGIEF